MFKTEHTFALTVLHGHGDFKKGRGHELRISTAQPDGTRALCLDLKRADADTTIEADEEHTTIEANEIRRVVLSNGPADSRSTLTRFPMGINLRRLPIVCAALAGAVIVPVIPWVPKTLALSIVAIAVLIEPQVRVVIELKDERYVCASVSEKGFGMVSNLLDGDARLRFS